MADLPSLSKQQLKGLFAQYERELFGGGLPEYLASLSRKKWQPGILDCGVFLADWVLQVCGSDPIADVRGTYSTERQFMRIVRGEGGFESACAARLASVGYREARRPVAGDIMIVLSPFAMRRGEIQRRPAGAICVSPEMRAVITSDLGVVIADEVSLPMLKAWTFRG